MLQCWWRTAHLPSFFVPAPGAGGFDSSRVPTPGHFPSKAKRILMPGGQPGGGGGGLVAAGIDWYISHSFFRTAILRKLLGITFSYKHCNFSHVCLLVKMASKTVTRSITVGLPWKWAYHENGPTMKIPEFRWCLTEITFNNPSQFLGMF